MIPVFSANAVRGELIKPTRFLPAIDWPCEHYSFAFGPLDIHSGNGDPDMSWGNYHTGWVAYVEQGGHTYLQKKLVNGIWDGQPRYLLALVGSIEKIRLEFAPSGHVMLGYLRPDRSLGVWWRSPQTGLPQLLELDTEVQDMLLSVENKNDPHHTDIFLWYFKHGNLYLRLWREHFANAHGPFLSGVYDPQFIQAGINHRYGYQVDYRAYPEAGE